MSAEPCEITPAGDAVRSAALQAKAARDAAKTRLACLYLDVGLTPEMVRRGPTWRPVVADVMDEVLRDEFKAWRELRTAP
jgi:hypothetical protein